MRILYLENHAVFAKEVCCQFLSAHQVTVLPTLSEAGSELARGHYDLMLVDYDLDDGKGDELVREARCRNPRLKIVAASSHDAGNAALQQAGADAICSKMDFQRIQEVIESLGIPKTP